MAKAPRSHPLLLSLLFLIVIFSNVARAIVNSYVRPTPQDGLFTLTFDSNADTPFSSTSDFESQMEVDLNDTQVPFVVSTLSSDYMINQLVLGTNVIPYNTELSLKFGSSEIADSASLDLPAASTLTDEDLDLIKIFVKIDYILEIVWIVASLLNPNWLLYMECKFYREMFDMFKKLNIAHEPRITKFFKLNNKGVAGLRLPNAFGIFLYKNNFASEWSLYPENLLGYGSVDSDRVEDLKVRSFFKEHEFSSFPLFLDLFGPELTFLVCVIIVGLIFEIVFQIMKKSKSESNASRIFSFLREKTWALLILSILGSFQSLSYYTLVQILAFFSENTTNNLISFAACIPIFLIAGFVACFFMIRTTLHNRRNPPELQKPHFFPPLLSFFKSNRLIYPLMILLGIPRAICFSLITVFVQSIAEAQTSILLAITLGILIGTIILRPYQRKLYLGFKITYEVLVALMLVMLLVLSIDSTSLYKDNVREGLGAAVVLLWLLIPIATIIFAVIGIYDYFKKSRSEAGTIHPLPVVKVFPEPVSAMEIVPIQQNTEQAETQNNEKPGLKWDDIRRRTSNSRVFPLPQKENSMQNQSYRAGGNENDNLIEQVQLPDEPKKENIKTSGLFLRPNVPEVRQNSSKAGKRIFPLEQVELKLNDNSKRVIDENGFREFMAFDKADN